MRLRCVFGLLLLPACFNPGSRQNSQTQATALNCYEMDRFSLCVPGIKQGKELIAQTELSAEQLAAAIQGWTGYATEFKPELISSEGIRSSYKISQLMPAFIAERFNTLANFSGPNCYNTALLASGGLEPDDLRYVSLDEFEVILSTSYEPIEAKDARFGDVVLFDADQSREHAALYLGHQVIFQKKDLHKGYGYRIVAIDAAYDDEPGEWKPSPFALHLTSPQRSTIKATKAFYRRVNPPSRLSDEPKQRLVKTISQELRTAAPKWKVAEAIGFAFERFIPQLRQAFSSMQKSSVAMERLAYAQLQSLGDQIFLNIDESLFSTPYAAAKEKKLKDQYCYDEKSIFLSELIHSISEALRPNPKLSSSEFKLIMEKMRRLDRQRCDIPLLTIIKDVHAD